MSHPGLSNLFSRRRFIRSSQSALALMGVTQFLGKSPQALAAAKAAEHHGEPTSMPVDYYDKLGVTKSYQCRGDLHRPHLRGHASSGPGSSGAGSSPPCAACGVANQGRRIYRRPAEMRGLLHQLRSVFRAHTGDRSVTFGCK